MNLFRLTRVCLALAGWCWLSASALAQSPSLGDVAKKEQDRRKNLPEAGKVYTNKDLPKSAVKPAEAGGAPAQAVASPEPSSAIPAEGEKKADDPDVKAKQSEAEWRKRMADAREGLRRNEMFAQSLQTRVNSLTQDVLSRSDPVQKSQLSAERKEALSELARVKQEIEAGKKQITDIEEEARKAGVPAGWVR